MRGFGVDTMMVTGCYSAVEHTERFGHMTCWPWKSAECGCDLQRQVECLLTHNNVDTTVLYVVTSSLASCG